MKLRTASSDWVKVSRKLTAGWLLVSIFTSMVIPLSLALVPQSVSAQCPGGVCPPNFGGGSIVPPALPGFLPGLGSALGAINPFGGFGNFGGLYGLSPGARGLGGLGGGFGGGGSPGGGGLGGGGELFGGGGLGSGGLRDRLASGLLGNLLQNPMFMWLLIMLLQQLFSGIGRGGATPQTGAVDELPSVPGSIGPRRTGPRDSGTALGLPPTVPVPAVTYRVDASGLSPSSYTIRPGEFIRIVNTGNADRTLYSDPHDPARPTPGQITDSCGTLSPNQACSVYFTEAGVFGFHVHDTPAQRALVIVQ